MMFRDRVRVGGHFAWVRLAGLLLVAGLWLAVSQSASAAATYTVKTLHIIVTVGPPNARMQCNVVGDLYTPNDATAVHPDPAILTTNGFGGSKDAQTGFSENFAEDGYVVFSYSGLGFGGSGCPIEVDDPLYDGEAASQLVTFLGGGLAATDGTKVNYVIQDAVAHDGRHYANDPRIGMVGGSYGGEVQFAAAEQDPRIDAIIPIITWNDLSYSLAPNNANLPADSVTDSVAGAAKYIWLNGFFGEGAAEDGAEQLANDPKADLTGCPNYPQQICGDAIQADATGAPSDATIALFRHASVESYMSNIRIPTLLAQGENDSLFQLREAVSTYDALRAQGTRVKMIWQSWGHSNLTPAPGEFAIAASGSQVNSTSSYALNNPNGSPTYEGTTFLQWFNHYLKEDPATPSLDFTFFRPWVTYSGNAAPAFGRSAVFPVATNQNLYLSGSNALVTSPGAVSNGTANFVTTAAGSATSYSEISVVEQNVEPGQEPYDVPGTFAEFETPPLAATTDVVGLPEVKGLRVSAPAQAATQGAGAAGDLVLFVKVYDISPTGTITLPDKLIAPIRIPAGGGPVSVSLPGIVHRFPAGDRIALVVAGGDQAYRGNIASGPVTVTVDKTADTVLQLPVAPENTYGPVQYAAVPGGCAQLSGVLSGSTLGAVKLDRTRASVHRHFGYARVPKGQDPATYCLRTYGTTVTYLTGARERAFGAKLRKALGNKVVLATTTNPFYTLQGVRPGALLSAAPAGLRAGSGLQVGADEWYLTRNGTVTDVLKVRDGVVEAVGVADSRLTTSRRAELLLLRG